VSGEVWITGIGLVTALGAGEAAQWEGLAAPDRWRARIDSRSMPPFSVHPIADLDLDRYIPKKGDQRAMGPLMHYGVAAASMALADAGVAGDADLLGNADLSVAAPCGERDLAVDEQILQAMAGSNDPGPTINERLLNDLRPTLFLAQLPNLFAGNISIVLGVAGSSRTFMGEEAAGIAALGSAFARVRSGQSALAVVGACFNASRPDSLLLYGPGRTLLEGPWRPLWDRPAGGMTLGSAGAFLVLESPAHARGRGRKARARLAVVAAEQSDRSAGAARQTAARIVPRLGLPPAALGVISGACGAKPITAEEHGWLAELAAAHPGTSVRGTAAALGHTMEASFPLNVALAALCLERGELFPPLAPDEPLEAAAPPRPLQAALVTGWGHHRGEGLALVEAAG
jgi:3-oxoacyl-[acyl-carrier-protein] synthase II